MNNQAYYDEFSQRYDHGRDHGYHALIDELETRVLDPFISGRDVLECGCGTGLILNRIRPLARRAVGVDLSPGMLEHARRRGHEVHHASVTELPFPDASFDVACSFKVLAHVEQIELALAEMARVLRPGGHLVAEFYNPYSLRYLVKRWKPPTRISDQTNDEAVFTRYDTLAQARAYLPPSLQFRDVYGVRVFTPVSKVHDLPLLGGLFRRLEHEALTAPILRHLGGFMVVVAQKQ